MHRLGGRIPIPASVVGGSSVRIGFGKIDSTPNPPSTSSLLSGGNNLAVPLNGNLSNQISFDGTTEQPTSALWLGSIPSTTTPATLLSIFGP